MSDSDSRVLITGASGLLGCALVREFLKRGFWVLAQYHKKKPIDNERCEWLFADFSQLKGIRNFLKENKDKFKDCLYLINNYGPITNKDISNLKSEDFLFDYHQNVITVFEITDFFVKNTSVKSVVNLGFEMVSKIKPYKNVLTYAIAKNSLLLLTKSFARKYSGIQFNMISPVTLFGASVKSNKEREISPGQAAKKIFESTTDKRTGLNYVF